MRTVLSLALVLSLTSLTSFTGCGGDDGGEEESFDTFQDCYDDHAEEESLPPAEAITVCVLEHPIAGEHLSFDTSADCVAYVTANLDDSATAEQIQAGCDDYITQKDM